MYTTLDHLSQHSQNPHRNKRHRTQWIFYELPVFGMFVFFASIVTTIFVNAPVFVSALTDLVTPTSTQNMPLQTTDIADVMQQEFSKQRLDNQIQGVLDEHEFDTSLIPQDPGYESTLKSKLNSYQLQFNTLPPTNRLVIDSIALNVPIVDVPFKTKDHIDKGSYEKELYLGVVKYPTTPTPDMKGNVFLFGHSSFYRWKQNNYGAVFKDLPKIEKGDEIRLVREGKEYVYRMIARHIVMPNQVNGMYDKYANGDYVTLMGCYPIGTDEKRMLIIAEKLR